uniref:Uncharacterized protein n=1 Tax=Anguilla anguilla TaxID=7936 RepID=A0A0E9PGC1_ANGAN
MLPAVCMIITLIIGCCTWLLENSIQTMWTSNPQMQQP